MVDEKKESGNKHDEDNDLELDAADDVGIQKAQDNDDDSSDDGVSQIFRCKYKNILDSNLSAIGWRRRDWH